MLNLPGLLPATRWLLPILVVILVLGHVCELSAYFELGSHHSAEGDTDGQVSSCDAVPATSSSTHPQMSASQDIAFVVPFIEPAPASRRARTLEDPVTLVERPPLFLLHSALLI